MQSPDALGLVAARQMHMHMARDSRPSCFFFALFWKWILDFRAAASSRQADFEARLERVRERED